MERLFTDKIVQEYRDRIGPMKYTLMNHAHFYTWWRDDVSPQPPTLTRQVSYDIAMKTCSQLGQKYSMDAIEGVKHNHTYDILVSVDETMPATTQEEKRSAISGFLITRLGECRQLADVYSIHLICVNPGGISGKILIGAFLYGLKEINHAYGILELARGYNNIPAFFAYSKMGFEKDLTLYGRNCFTDLEVLPMSVHVEDMTKEDILDYVKGKKRVVQDDTRLFETGIPTTPRQEQLQSDMAALAQYYYLHQLAELYNEHGEFNDYLTPVEEIKARLHAMFRDYKCDGKCTISGGTKTRKYRAKSKRYSNNFYPRRV